MPKKKHAVDQIIHKLREAEVLLSQGRTVAEVCRSLGINEQTYYRWRKEYGGLRMEQARRLKQLEQENTRLRTGWHEFPGAGLSRPESTHSTFVLLSIAFLPIALGNASLIHDSHVCIHFALVLVPAQVQTNLLREESRDGQAQKEESNEEGDQEEGEEKEEEVAQVYPPAEVPPTRGTRTNGFPFPLPKFLVRQSRWFLPSQHQHKKALRPSSVRPFVLYTLRHTFLARLGGRGCDAWRLASVAGHSSIAISARYVHPSEEAVLAAMNRMQSPRAPSPDFRFGCGTVSPGPVAAP